MDTVPTALTAWESFYVIVGSSGAALTGLQFVVMALIADSEMERSAQEVDAFGTPTVVHFCAVLLIAAVVSAPWPGLTGVVETLATLGAAGIGYLLVVTRRARRTRAYKPVLEDWVWHVVLPFVAYGAVFGGALAMTAAVSRALFVIGGAALLLLFIGIHNAWDTVTFVAIERLPGGGSRPPE
jgi:hypothetical protein